MKISFCSSMLKFTLAFACLFFLFSCSKRSGKPTVLIFSKTAGFHHSAIPNGIAAIQKLGAENNFETDTTTNAAWFNDDSLKKYSAVIFLSTTGDILNSNQETAFERYIQSGGGYVGIHAASDAEYDWGWYGRLVGAYFDNHPAIQEAVLKVVDSSNAATKGLPAQWKRTDEWYNFKKISKDIHVLLTIDENSYKGGTNGNFHPMAWYHDYDGGRAFYTELGHTEASYTDPLYLRHILGGIQYAIGDNAKLDYAKAKSQYPPDEDRFVKTTLVEGTFFEPTEMAILPNLDILVAQRRGEILRYSNKTKDVKQVGFLNVYYHTLHTPGVNAEEGVLGMAPDPEFAKNNYVYIYYSPVDTSVNRLSRFVYKDDRLDTSSEKVVLEVHAQREICCHTGGSIAFGADHLLFLSTGDNSTPFDEANQPYASHGYAPLDDRPGHQQYDSRRSAGNTNDLRGKILRIKINPDGSYTIPQGNLFPPNTPKTRPEIYVMGDRNPYRIAVDKKTGFVYWGEVGPDAGEDSLTTRGPRGYDEYNQARKAGFFGWPLFVGNNYAYHPHNYATNENGEAFNPAKPINNSRNNTGLQELPPAQPAYIWYPYAASPDFPDIGSGGRTAMAGPVYYTADYPKDTRLPDYYNGKLFIYEWMRNWIKVVTMMPNGDFDKMEPFMEGTKFHAPIDMEVGPDGKIYVLEYGSGWFSKNADAGLCRIDYISGNRPPKVDSLQVDKTSGALPLTINAHVQAKDPENDKLTYEWTIGTTKKQTSGPQLQYTINQPGEYPVTVNVTDDKNAASKSNTVTVYAGNSQPQVAIAIDGNRSFYFPGKPVIYHVKATDPGDQVDSSNLFVSTDYVQGNEDMAEQGHQIVSASMMGKNLIMSLDCKNCHKVNEKSIGPAFTLVAQRYHKDPKAPGYLMNKIIKGGSGAWGETAMPSHPTLKDEEARQIVEYVLSLSDEKASKSMPASGKVIPAASKQQKPNTFFALMASYTDKGGSGVKPLTGTQAVYLKSSIVDAGNFHIVSGFTNKDSSGSRYLVFPNAEGAIMLNQVDLTNIRELSLTGFGSGQAASYAVEIRLDKLTGTEIANSEIHFAANNQKTTAAIPIQQLADGRLHDIYIICKPATAVSSFPLLKTVQFVAK